MNTYIINYDLIAPGKNYDRLFEAIKSYGTWAHVLESCWLIKSSLSATEVRNHLVKYIDNNDKLLVAKSGNQGAWRGLKENQSDWLRKNM